MHNLVQKYRKCNSLTDTVLFLEEEMNSNSSLSLDAVVPELLHQYCFSRTTWDSVNMFKGRIETGNDLILLNTKHACQKAKDVCI